MPGFLGPKLPSLTMWKGLCYMLWSPFNHCQKGKLLMWVQSVLNALWIRQKFGAISLHFYHKCFKGWTIWSQEWHMFLKAKVSTRVSDNKVQDGCWGTRSSLCAFLVNWMFFCFSSWVFKPVPFRRSRLTTEFHSLRSSSSSIPKAFAVNPGQHKGCAWKTGLMLPIHPQWGKVKKKMTWSNS